jgi:hypothetical protein
MRSWFNFLIFFKFKVLNSNIECRRKATLKYQTMIEVEDAILQWYLFQMSYYCSVNSLTVNQLIKESNNSKHKNQEILIYTYIRFFLFSKFQMEINHFHYDSFQFNFCKFPSPSICLKSNYSDFQRSQ